MNTHHRGKVLLYGRLVSSSTGLDLTKQENMLLFVNCSETTLSKLVKLRPDVILAPMVSVICLVLAWAFQDWIQHLFKCVPLNLAQQCTQYPPFKLSDCHFFRFDTSYNGKATIENVQVKQLFFMPIIVSPVFLQTQSHKVEQRACIQLGLVDLRVTI